jgi:two-component system CheB/CheR fusion protein
MSSQTQSEKRIEVLLDEINELRAQRLDLLRRLNEERKKNAAISVNDQFPLAEISSLTNGIVHDLRSGLGVIRNTIGFVKDDLTDRGHQSDLLKISHSLDFCDLVLRNLSALGGQDVFQPKWINLEATVREIYFILERKLVDVKLILETDSGVLEIMADEGQIKQVFMNLIKNAGEAMPDGGTLTVRIRRDGEMARIEVSDTGSGIAPENQARLFKEFFTTKDRGYGLGLHIVKTIVERHGGTAFAESVLGEGTTFVLQLPIEAA